MTGSSAASGTRNDRLLDVAGLTVIAVSTLVCAVLALLGSSVARQVLPFLPGALVGDGLLYLAIRTPRYRKALVVLAILLVAASLILSFTLFVGMGTGLPVRLPWEVPGVVEKLAAGVLLGFGGYVLSLIVVPSLDGPESWKEAVQQRRGLVRVTHLVGGVLLARVVLVALVLGALALVAYFAGTSSRP